MQHYFTTLENTIKLNWDGKALCNYKSEEFKFSELAEAIAKFHLLFEEIGIKKGDKIALCAKNSARWAVSFLSINTYGAVVVPLLADFLPESINHLVDHADSVMLFTDPETWEKLDEEKMPKLKATVSTKDFSLLFSREKKIENAYSALTEKFSAKYPMGFSRENVVYEKIDQKEVAVINYTSGTTSAPKGVMLRYESFSAMVDFALRNVSCDNSDKIVSMLPMGHIYGLVFEFIYPLCGGATVYYLGKTPSPSLLLKAMQEVKPYLVCTVPLVMEKVYKSSLKPVLSKWYMKVLRAIPGISNILNGKIRGKLQAAFGGNVRHFIMGGAALNPEVEKCFRSIKLNYCVGYGMTEACPLLAYEHWAKFAPGSCGKAVDCCDIRIDSEDPEHIAGEIQAKGANICSGYYKYPEADSTVFTDDGYLHTGDLGIMDKHGNIFIKGRSKNMILSANGQNIYPEEVEAVINSQPYVAESVVVDRSSKLVALVYLDEDSIKKAALDEETISDIPENVRVAANRSLPGYSQITKVEVVLTPFEKTPKMSIRRFLYK